MNVDSIKHQHFWINLTLGAIMVFSLVANPLEKGLISLLILSMIYLACQTIQKGRIAAEERAARKRAEQEERARQAAERLAKMEALRQAQREAAEKYLEA